MSTDSIIKHIVDENIISAKKETEALLYSKLNDSLEYYKNSIISDTYADAIGLASVSEKKKTDDEDDGDGLDPVGAEDSDVDNDGDSDESDDYLNNRRKTVGKAIKKKKNGDDEDEELDESRAGDILRKVGRGIKKAAIAVSDPNLIGKLATSVLAPVAQAQMDAAQRKREEHQASPAYKKKRKAALEAARERRTGNRT